jgi:hypothetical protein
VGLGMTAGASGQTPDRPPPRIIRAVRATAPPVIDGRLTDEAWSQAPVAEGFTQRDPEEGKPATERTEIRVLFDDTAVYVGARMFDAEPGRIERRLSSRDSDPDADRVTVFLDPMRDKLTGAIFRVSAANVQQDAALYNDSWWDNTWDAVWQSQVSTDDQGWSAELRIPLSQLRFATQDRQTWGINVERFVRRKNEYSWLEMVPKHQNGNASRMLELTGLDGMRPRRNLELLPYVAGRTEFIQPSSAGNPFNDGSRAFGAAGLDVKWGLTSNLTVSATVNPDFGQVEVDPAVVNLTAFETFFSEKRPFFLEGSQIFNNFGRGGANDFWGFNQSEPQIFYSRRIGRAPQLTASGDYVDAPSATTILGAAKLTGKTSGRWSLGLLQALTGEETARTHMAGLDAGREVVEPLTSYTVARVQREVGQRAGLGFLATSVGRQLPSQAARDGLSRQALVVGTDAYWFVDADKQWVITGDIASSRVAGTATLIERLQRAPQRYYQRPDEPHVDLDPTRTSLSGFKGRLNLNRNSGMWRLNAALWTGSPGWESNDLGFHGTGDRAGAHAVVWVQGNKPRRFSRSRSAWVAKAWSWNYGRELQSDTVNGQVNNTFMNYWGLGGNFGTRRRVLDDRLTRGGPSAQNPAGGFVNVYGSTDSRRWLSVSGNYNTNWSESGGRSRNANLSFNLKPSPRLSVSTGPQWNRSRQIAQYVTSVVDATATDTYGGRYVFGLLEQTQLTMTTRVSVIVTPTVSLQVFAQPLLAVGDYGDFKELARPRTYDFLHYGATGSIAYDSLARSYAVDPDGMGAAPGFTFNDPDFNFKSLRLNAVFRWEMKPGSAFYAVWTRQQVELSHPGVFAPGRDARALFGARGDDVFLVKMAYWLGR